MQNINVFIPKESKPKFSEEKKENILQNETVFLWKENEQIKRSPYSMQCSVCLVQCTFPMTLRKWDAGHHGHKSIEVCRGETDTQFILRIEADGKLWVCLSVLPRNLHMRPQICMLILPSTLPRGPRLAGEPGRETDWVPALFVRNWQRFVCNAIDLAPPPLIPCGTTVVWIKNKVF